MILLCAQKNRRKTRGFTLVESLVAVTIVAVSISIILNVLTNSFQYAKYAGDQVTATFLAEEGYELVVNARDNNVQDGVAWLTNIPADGSKFTIDPLVQGTFTACPSGVCPVLKLDANGNFTYQSGTATVFYREISILPISNNGVVNEALITVMVYWPDSTKAHKVTFNGHISSWNDFR